MSGTPTPLYIVCSPFRCVGTTLVARLIAEFYALTERPVAAFDLADEGPQLSDFLPDLTTAADISCVRSQMAFFDRLIDDNSGAKIVDVNHRAFTRFCAVVHEIGLCAEARNRAFEPRVLFIPGPDPTSAKSAEAHATLEQAFTSASLLPVRNQIEIGEREIAPALADTALAAVHIPQLGFSLRAMIDRPAFSFAAFLRTPTALSAALTDELQDWIADVFCQFRALAQSVAGAEPPMRPAVPPRRRPRTLPALPSRERPLTAPRLPDLRLDHVPEQVRKFAPKRLRQSDSDLLDQSGEAIIAKLQAAAGQLRAAEHRIDQLETEIEHVQDRTVRAETWLNQIRQEIEQKLITPTVGGNRRS